MGSVTIRLPDELLAQLRQMADQDHRSINGEILWLIEQGLTRRGNHE